MAAQKPRFTPKQFATVQMVEDLAQHFHDHITELSEDIASLQRTQVIFEQALIKTLQDVESMSDALVDAGILTDDEDEQVEEAEEAEEAEERPGVGYPEFFDEAEWVRDIEEGKLTRVVVDPDNSANEAEVEESQEEREARIAAVRARRAAAVERTGVLEEFEDANESDPLEAETDPNSIGSVPEEGIVIIPGRATPNMQGGDEA